MSENLAVFFTSFPTYLCFFRLFFILLPNSVLRFGFLIKFYIDYSGLIIFFIEFHFSVVVETHTFPESLSQLNISYDFFNNWAFFLFSGLSSIFKPIMPIAFDRTGHFTSKIYFLIFFGTIQLGCFVFQLGHYFSLIPNNLKNLEK